MSCEKEYRSILLDTAKKIAKKYPLEYWMEKDEKCEFAEEFWKDIVDAGFLGILVPEEYGGSNLTMEDLYLVIRTLCENGCGMAGNWYICLTEVFGALPIVKFGTEEQKKKYLPGSVDGKIEFCMALRDPNAGSNTFRIETFASKTEKGFVVNGTKVFISGADRAKGMLLVTRTKKLSEVENKTDGITLFLVDLPNPRVKVSPISKHGINYSHSCEVCIEDLELTENDILGGPQSLHKGWKQLIYVLDPERIVFTAAAIGIGMLAIKKAVEYASTRKVIGEPIGSYQSLQHPLAESYAHLECANLMALEACRVFDSNGNYRELARASNIAKVVAVEAATRAVYWAMQIHGGYGYAKEYHVERWWREINLIRLAPVTQQMALNYIASNVLGLPRGYK
jgi:acyl-CoA dehydrogenase